MAVLYLSRDGLMQPIGQSQILPYVERLSVHRPITLITFEKPSDLDDAACRQRFDDRVQGARLHWIRFRFHNRPRLVGQAWDLLLMLLAGSWVCLRERPRIIHARGFTVAVIGLALAKLFRRRLIFDVRGVSWVEQRVEIGSLREGSLTLAAARWLEQKLFADADVLIALSAQGADEMRQLPVVAARPGRIRVVTTCVDTHLFSPQDRSPSHPLTIGYVGNAGAGYLFEPVLQLYSAIREQVPDARLKIINRNDHVAIREMLTKRGLGEEAVELRSCDHAEVPSEMRDMDLGAFFYKWAEGHSAPVFTRMGEFLACGIPCVSNGRGMTQDVFEADGVGVFVAALDQTSIRSAAAAIIKLATCSGIRQRCVASAYKYFSLDAGAKVFEAAYRQLEVR